MKFDAMFRMGVIGMELEAFAKDPPQMKKIRLKTVGGLDICHPTNIGAPKEGGPPEMLPTYSGG